MLKINEVSNIAVIILLVISAISICFNISAYEKISNYERGLQLKETVAGFDAHDLETKLLTGELKLIRGERK